ncbi:CAP domain-containing protein [Fimbriiglobus ruber]|uniref:Pathogenesis-related protein 1C n=1 Tax=Fimbriiglobus ruber TaxID=1908690 RepID=A0A225DYH4_9BACT|nr:CAP domain-containing protein [Fimbriiglobus ruber]OWK43588.1 Pathogenesis-related protein 1C precursor [Fimbriiglobus ruber]
MCHVSIRLLLSLSFATAAVTTTAFSDDTRACGGSALTAEEIEDLVSYHNRVRKEVGAEPVKWSEKVAAVAQEWADHLAEIGKLEHRPRTGKSASPYGENLAINQSVRKGAEAWYAEKKDYTAGDPIPKDFANFKAGHYTQMVWSKTTEIGAGKAVVKSGRFKGETVLVTNYNPPGNFIGRKPY